MLPIGVSTWYVGGVFRELNCTLSEQRLSTSVLESIPSANDQKVALQTMIHYFFNLFDQIVLSHVLNNAPGSHGRLFLFVPDINASSTVRT